MAAMPVACCSGFRIPCKYKLELRGMDILPSHAKDKTPRALRFPTKLCIWRRMPSRPRDMAVLILHLDFNGCAPTMLCPPIAIAIVDWGPLLLWAPHRCCLCGTHSPSIASHSMDANEVHRREVENYRDWIAQWPTWNMSHDGRASVQHDVRMAKQ